MAVVQGVKEKVHLPIYDSTKVKPEEQLKKAENFTGGILKFFVDVQGKTKLETNLQSAGLLPHYNTFEARAMRVVISDLPPEFPQELDEPTAEDEDLDVTDEDDIPIVATAFDSSGNATAVAKGTGASGEVPITADIELTLPELIALLKEAEESEDGFAELFADDEGVTLFAGNAEVPEQPTDLVSQVANLGSIWLSVEDILDLIEDIGDQAPPRDQLLASNGGATIISKLIYNTVTTFFVGEKEMIRMPTWFFPSGAGTYSESAKSSTHGEPDPTATFRFAEPVFIDKQQNFRVEIEIPDSDALKEIERLYGPLFIWVVLDGYMTRDVQ